MSVASGDEGMGNLARKRVVRKSPEQASPSNSIESSQPAQPITPVAKVQTTTTITRLDDLYRLPMPKLFAHAE